MSVIIKIIIFLLFLSGLVLFLINQRNNIKQWLLYAVIEAEKNLGSKRGVLKLRQVYDEFISVFPCIAGIITFNSFSHLVDMALEEMEEVIKSNVRIKEYIEGEEND